MLLALIVAISLSFPIEAAKPVPGYGSQPIHFEPAGQPFDYIARTSRYTLLVSGHQARFHTPQGQAISMHLAGARHTTPAAPQKLPGVSHYYLGADATHWRTNVPHYSRVRWPQVYPGIDVIYYSQNREIEFDFEISPGADARDIQLRFDGADQIRINKDGALELTTPNGILLKRPPIAYQLSRNGKRRNIPVRYALHNNQVTFALAAYDKHRALTIDPSVAYSTYLGGEGADKPAGLAVDVHGSAYLTGTTTSAFFPGAGLKPAATELGFVTKLSPAGNSIVYSLYLNATPGAIAVDTTGAVYLSGHTSGNLAVKNAFQPQLAGVTDAFVAKFQPDGTLAFATYLGGSGEENGRVLGGVLFDRNGAISIAGWTKSTNFPLKNAVQSTYAGGQDAFVAKLDPTGAALVFSTYLGGTADDFPNGFDLDPAGNPVLVGRTLSPDFPTYGARQSTRLGFSDGFLARFDGAEARLLYSSYVGHSAFSTLDSVAASPDGTLAVTGVGSICAQTYWCVGRFSTTNEFTLFYGLNYVPFRSVSFDPFGNLIVVAIPDLENTAGRPNVTLVDPVRNKMIGDDPLLLQFRPDGRMLFSTFWGGSSTSFSQSAIGAVADSSGALYLAGYTTAPDIYTTPSAVQPAPSQGSEIFLVKFAPGANQTITSVRVQTNTHNVPVTANGRTTTLASFQLLPGDTLRVEAPERFETPYSRHFFRDWNNGGPRSQIVTAGVTDLFLQANYIEDVKIETIVEPAGAGTIEISPVPVDGFYRVNSPVTIRARPAPGFVFSSWSGDLVFGANPDQIRVVGYAPSNAPLRIRAKFVPGVPQPTGLSFVPVMPCRILDTRPEYGFAAPFGAPALDAGATREVAVAASNCGIPQGAGAYALNITAVPLEPLGYLTAFAAGQPRPGTSTLNANDGQTVANHAIVAAGTNGAISVFTTNRTHLLIDITGYFTQNASPLLAGMMLNCRLLDTRNGAALQPGQVREIPGTACISQPGTQAAWVTVTAYPKGPLRFLSLTSGTPSVSTLNSPLGEIRSNTSIIPWTGSTLAIQTSDTTDATVDVGMFLVAGSTPLRYYPVAPCRTFDTRTTPAGPLKANTRNEHQLAGTCNLPFSAYTFVVNATVIPAAAPASFHIGTPSYPIGLLTAMQAPARKPTANLLLINSGPWVEMLSTTEAHVILDVLGYFAP